MSTQYAGRTGAIYELKDEKLASGGEGTIYEILGNENQVAKIFKEKYRTEQRRNKLLVMLSYDLDTEQLSEITWPQDILYDKGGFVGYVMPKLKNVKNLNVVYSKGMDEIGLKERVVIAYNICVAVGEVHKIGQVCGDLNPQNICVNLDSKFRSQYHVTLVDTDSYHITKDGTTFRCGVGLGQYIAPELQKKQINGMNLATIPLPTFTKETDLFALAVHIFNLLMGGCHPFACAKEIEDGYINTMEAMNGEEVNSVALPQPIENIKEGFFPFHQKREGITYPLYAPAFDSLPNELQRLFIRTFEEGYDNPILRVSAEEWKDALMKVAKDIGVLSCSKGHMYFNHIQDCPYCEAKQRMNKMFTPIGDIPPKQDTSDMIIDNYSSVFSPKTDEELGFGKVTGILVAIIIIIAFLIVLIALCIEGAKRGSGNLNYESEYSYQDDYADATVQIKNNRQEIGEKIYKEMKEKKYSSVANKAYDYEDVEDDVKIYICEGKLVNKINNGYGLIYNVDGSYVYLGSIKNGKADGEGIEVGKDEWGDGYYTLKGSFKKGYAYGQCTYFTSVNEMSDGKKYKSTITGNYKNGYENGDMKEKIDYISSSEHSETYYWYSKMGERQVIRYEDGEYIYAESDSDWYLYYSEKVSLSGHGVPNTKG